MPRKTKAAKTEKRTPWKCPKCGEGVGPLVCEGKVGACYNGYPHGEVPSQKCTHAHCRKKHGGCGWKGTLPQLVRKPKRKPAKSIEICEAGFYVIVTVDDEIVATFWTKDCGSRVAWKRAKMFRDTLAPKPAKSITWKGWGVLWGHDGEPQTKRLATRLTRREIEDDFDRQHYRVVATLTPVRTKGEKR